MTRINSGVKPEKLLDQHLIAEYREIGRIGTLLEKRILNNKPLNDTPKEFTLGKGHVNFFLNKGKFIHNRFEELKTEMNKRGFSANLEFRNIWIKYNKLELYNDYRPTEKDIEQIESRIKLRTPKHPRFYRKTWKETKYE